MNEKTRDSLIVSGITIALVNILCLVYYSFADNEFLLLYLIMLGVPLALGIVLALTEKTKLAYILLWIITVLHGAYVLIPLLGMLAGLAEGLEISAFSTLTLELIVFIIPCIIAVRALIMMSNSKGE